MGISGGCYAENVYLCTPKFKYIFKSTKYEKKRLRETDDASRRVATNLLLADGARLETNHISLGYGNTLHIYGQSNDSGQLIVNQTETGYAGIGGGLLNCRGLLQKNGFGRFVGIRKV